MRIRPFLSYFLIFSLAFLAFPAFHSEAKGTAECSAASAILYHPASGSVLYEKDADRRRPIASTTKIITALTVLSEGGDLDRPVAVPKEACGVEGSSLWLKCGETLTVRELLYGLLLSSANDAAAALAVLHDGSIAAFAEKMNAKANELGAINSHFMNPHGLDDPEHYSTARDLAAITAAALENDLFREIVSTRRYSIASPDGGRRYLVNHNKLLSFLPDCIGVKTGFTKKSGRCLVSAAERNETTLICVTLNDPNDWNDHISLLEYGFASMESKTLLQAGEFTFDCPVVNGKTETVRVKNADGIMVLLPASSPLPERFVRLPRFLPAPLRAGEIVGYVGYKVNGKTIGESPLIVGESVDEIRYKKGLFHL